MTNQLTYRASADLRRQILEASKGLLDRHPATRERSEDLYDELRARAERLGVEVPFPREVPKLAATVLAATEGDETEATRAVTALRQWHDAQRRTMFGVETAPSYLLALSGPAGCGKSVAAVRAVIRSKDEARFVRAEDVGATARNASFVNAAAWDIWLHVPLLAIDDLGLERGEKDLLSQLIGERWDLGGATIVTTNLEQGVFATTYLGKVANRMLDRLKTQPLWFARLEGASLRKQYEEAR